MVVLMPAALSPGRSDRQRIFYTRATWQDQWPTSDVICFSDPAIGQDSRLNGAWYMHRDYDVIQALADLVMEQADSRNISHNRIVVYGSSLGGFGALMLAAHIPGARAVAEVPQLDFALWLPSAVAEVEQYILGEPVKEFRKRHPERVSVLHRFLFASRIPKFSILTNGNDFRIAEQRNFMQWVRQSKLPKNGMNLLIENDTTYGHEVLSKDQLVQFVQP